MTQRPKAPEAAPRLPKTAAAWKSPNLAPTLAAELAPLLAAHPLITSAGEQGGRIDPDSITVTLLDRQADASQARLALGVFCLEVVGGCSCGDAPYTAQVYLELMLHLDLATGRAQLLPRTD
jgi:hypothetical protein